MSYNAISFCFCAHPDDWMLMMNPNMTNQLVNPTTRQVFVIVCAGDGSTPFWREREEGVKAAIRLKLDWIHSGDQSRFLPPNVTGRDWWATFVPMQEQTIAKTINGKHTVQRWECLNAVCYFLRLPDEDMHGGALQVYKQSLDELRQLNKPLTSVDCATTYASWQDFCDTLQGIVDAEADGLQIPGAIWLNYPDPDETVNRDDHVDHLDVGRAVEGMPSIAKYNRALFIGYHLTNLNEAVMPASAYKLVFEKTMIFGAWCQSAFASGAAPRFDQSSYADFCIRYPQYRTITRC